MAEEIALRPVHADIVQPVSGLLVFHPFGKGGDPLVAGKLHQRFAQVQPSRKPESSRYFRSSYSVSRFMMS